MHLSPGYQGPDAHRSARCHARHQIESARIGCPESAAAIRSDVGPRNEWEATDTVRLHDDAQPSDGSPSGRPDTLRARITHFLSRTGR